MSGETRCEACGTGSREGDLFCSSCGKALPDVSLGRGATDGEPLGKTNKRCSQCGTESDENDRFCGSCGNALPNGSLATETVTREPSGRSDKRSGWIREVQDEPWVEEGPWHKRGITRKASLAWAVLIIAVSILAIVTGTASFLGIVGLTAALIWLIFNWNERSKKKK